MDRLEKQAADSFNEFLAEMPISARVRLAISLKTEKLKEFYMYGYLSGVIDTLEKQVPQPTKGKS